jgi:hypothetical protein
MMTSLFACSHRKITFPLTRKIAQSPYNGPYVTCLDCGMEFKYDWATMRIGEAIVSPPRLAVSRRLQSGKLAPHVSAMP